MGLYITLDGNLLKLNARDENRTRTAARTEGF